LPAGVRVVEGRFEKGDAVVVRDEQGGEIARGLSRYDAIDAEKIRGARSSDIEAPARLYGRRQPDPRRRPGAQR